MADKFQYNSNADNLQIIKDLWKTFGNNPRNQETFDAMANFNPFMSGYRGVKTLSNVDMNAIKQAYLNEAYGNKNAKADLAAAKQVGNVIGGLLDVAPVAGIAAKPAVAGAKMVGREFAPQLANMAENYMFDNGLALSAIPRSKAKEMAGLLGSVDETGMSEADKLLLNTFGTKAEREASALKKVKKLATQESTQGSKSIVSGNAGALPPDYFRTLYNTDGEDAVLKKAFSGEHLKRRADGTYVGAPAVVDSPQSLAKMRSNYDTQFNDAVNAIAQSENDPSRIGTWYDRAKASMANSTEPWQLSRSLEQHGQYSAGNSPENELGFTLGHWNSRAIGMHETPFRGPVANRLDLAVEQNIPTKMGFKIGQYANKENPLMFNGGPFGVNDFRAAQSWSYTDPKGNPWRAGVTGTMHPVMDAETAMAVDRANKAGIGGRTNWHGPQLQEAPWVLGKAEDMYGRGFKARYSPDNFGGNVLEGIKQSVRDANNTIGDYMPKHTFSSTWEAIPGNSTNHVPSMLLASPEEKLAYTKEGSWVEPGQTIVGPDGHIVGEGNRDVIHSAIGFRQLPALEASGIYKNMAGNIENNPVVVSRPLVNFAKGSPDVNANTLSALNFGDHLRGVVDAQEAYAGNLPKTLDSASGRSHVLLDSGEKMATPEQMVKLSGLLQDQGFSPTATSRGVLLYNEADSPQSIQASKLIKKLGGQLTDIFPSKPMNARMAGGYYEPAIGKWGENGIVPTAPFSGEATAGLLNHAAEAPPEVVRNISESDAVRRKIGEKILRDDALPGAREDIQNMRRFLKDADWNRAVEMIRKGMTPAAAVASLGYNLSSMAEESR